MISTREISRLERRLLVILALLPCLILILYVAGEAISTYNQGVASHQRQIIAEASGRPMIRFSSCTFGSYGPAGFHLLAPFVVLSLLKPKRFVAAMILSTLYAGTALISIYAHAQLLMIGHLSDIDGSVRGYVELWFWDIFTILAAFPTFLWLSTIMWRLYAPRYTIYR